MYEEQIDAGIMWLDVNRPDWRKQITGELDMMDSNDCVLGQTGGYFNALRQAVPYGKETWDHRDEKTWNRRDAWANDHGFRVDNIEQFDQLTTEWHERLSNETV